MLSYPFHSSLRLTYCSIKNALRRTFADKANSFAVTLSTLSLAISGLEGDVDDQLVHVRRLHLNLPPLQDYLESLSSLHVQCEEANIEENDFTTYTYDELLYEHTLVVSSVAKKLAFLENQLVARDMTNLTPIQLEEFESVFRHFDRSGSNSLSEAEFAAALASLGLVYGEAEMHSRFLETSSFSQQAHNRARDDHPPGSNSLCHHISHTAPISPPMTPTMTTTPAVVVGQHVSFEGFIRFMVSVTEDQNTAEQVFESFREVADGKAWVTEIDLRHSLIPEELVEELVGVMPVVGEEEGAGKRFDYVRFMDRITDGWGKEITVGEQSRSWV